MVETETDSGVEIDEADLGRLVKRRHPEYTAEYEKHINFLEATYKSERSWFKDNIFKYYKEGSSYDDRVARAIRYNHSREIVDLTSKYISRAKIIRNTEDAPDCLVDFWQNYDGKGSHVDELSKELGNKTSRSGRHWVVLDNAIKKGQIVTKADEDKFKKEGGVAAYAYVVSPIDFLDASYDRYGALNWVLYRTAVRDDIDPFKEFDINGTYIYKYWDRKQWIDVKQKDAQDKRQKAKYEIVGSGVHNLGIVPITHCDHNISKEKYVSQGMLNDVAYLDRIVANYLSNLDVIINDQTFSQMIMPYQSLTAYDDDEKQVKIKQMSTSNVMLYDATSVFKPEFISPDASQAELIITYIKTIVGEIYHTIGLAGERTKQDNAIGIDNSSGVAKAFDFERVNAMLTSKAQAMDACEKRIAEIVCAYHGTHPPETGGERDYIKYPEDFDTRGISDEFDIALNLQTLAFPKEVRREQAKTVIEKINPRASEAKIKELEDSLKDWPEDIPVDPLTGKPQDNAGGRGNGSGQDGLQKPSRQGQVTPATK